MRIIDDRQGDGQHQYRTPSLIIRAKDDNKKDKLSLSKKQTMMIVITIVVAIIGLVTAYFIFKNRYKLKQAKSTPVAYKVPANLNAEEQYKWATDWANKRIEDWEKRVNETSDATLAAMTSVMDANIWSRVDGVLNAKWYEYTEPSGLGGCRVPKKEKIKDIYYREAKPETLGWFETEYQNTAGRLLHDLNNHVNSFQPISPVIDSNSKDEETNQ